MDPRYYDIAKRFQYAPSNEENLSIQNDEHAYHSLPEEIIEDVQYPRVAFNWPAQNLPQANYAPLTAMAIQQLKKYGYHHEARMVNIATKNNIVTYTQLPELLYRFLDFSPSIISPELKALAEQQNIALNPTKKTEPNPIVYDEKLNLDRVVPWLKTYKNVLTSYGKDAVFYIPSALAGTLCTKWLQESSPSEEQQWFIEHYPLGWGSRDYIGDTALALLQGDIEDIIPILLWQKRQFQSLPLHENEINVLLLGYKNYVGITGEATLSIAISKSIARFLNTILEGKTLTISQELRRLFCDFNEQSTITTEQIWKTLYSVLPNTVSATEEVVHQKLQQKKEKNSTYLSTKEKTLLELKIANLEALKLQRILNETKSSPTKKSRI